MAIHSQWVGAVGAYGLYRKYTGSLKIEDIMQANIAVMGDARSDDMRYIVADFLDLEQSAISIDDVIKISTFDKPATRQIHRLKIAFVVRGETQQALARLYEFQTPTSAWQFELFDCLDDARQWATSDDP